LFTLGVSFLSFALLVFGVDILGQTATLILEAIRIGVAVLVVLPNLTQVVEVMLVFICGELRTRFVAGPLAQENGMILLAQQH
jgi:hypothetical protein